MKDKINRLIALGDIPCICGMVIGLLVVFSQLNKEWWPIVASLFLVSGGVYYWAAMCSLENHE